MESGSPAADRVEWKLRRKLKRPLGVGDSGGRGPERVRSSSRSEASFLESMVEKRQLPVPRGSVGKGKRPGLAS